jgi:hypothetical protein
MNYNLVNTTYFLIFVIIAATAFAAIPAMKTSFADVSDTYVKSQISRIQGEMFFMEQTKGNFKNACFTGEIGLLVQDMINEYGEHVVCRTNSDYSKMIVYAKLRAGDYLAVDSAGITCNTSYELKNNFSCKGL